MKFSAIVSAFAILAASVQVAVAQQQDGRRNLRGTVRMLKAKLNPEGNPSITDGVVGTVTFTNGPFFKKNGLTEVTYDISGLSPGLHGLHVHEIADFSDGCSSTLGHYNPKHVNHGSNLDAQRHIGDLGNILADENGVAQGMLLAYAPLGSIKKLAVVVHAGTDDLGTGGDAGSRAVGNAGARPACGRIRRVK